MSDLTLYYAVPSRGMVVHWMLEEIGQPYETRILSLTDEEHKTPEFLALNPMGRVPVLTHGDRVVTETAAIVMYLAEAFPEAGMDIAIDSPDRAAYLRWLFFAPVSAEPSVMWESLGKVQTDSGYLPFSDIETVAGTIAAAVRGKAFIVGDHFTAADVMMGSTVMWGTQLMPVLPALPELLEYWRGLEQRPAWQKSFGDDQKLMS